MRKIKSLFRRDWDGNPNFVTNQVEPGFEWVIRNEGVPTKKWDGTSCMIKDGVLYKRYDRKRIRKGEQKGEWKSEPEGWISCEKDEKTGHWVGWIPVDFDRPENWMHREAWELYENPSKLEMLLNKLRVGLSLAYSLKKGNRTYELCGPKINGNPENLDEFVLIPHGLNVLEFRFQGGNPHDELKEYLRFMDVEGIVWWYPYGYSNELGQLEPARMAKVKKSDFGLPRKPVQGVLDES